MKKSITLLTSILALSGCVFAKETKLDFFKTYKSNVLMCGQTKLQVISNCNDPLEGAPDRGSAGIVRECKDSSLYLDKIKVSLPYMGEVQKKSLEARGYKFNKNLDSGTWSLVSLTCTSGNVNGKPLNAIILNQATSNNVNEMDHGKANLWDNPVVTDLKGNILPKDQSEKITKLTDQNKIKQTTLFANAVYGGE